MKNIFFIASLLIGLVSTTNAQRKIELNLKKGDEFTMTNVIDQDITQNVMGQEVKVDLSISMTLDLKVLEFTDESVTFSQVYTSISMDMNSPMQGVKMTINSDDPADDLNKTLKEITGKEVTVKVNRKGDVLEVSGMDELMSGIEGLAASGADLGQFLDEDSIEKNYQSLFPVEYGKAYTNGETWEMDNSSEGDLSVSSVATYTASDVSKKSFEYTVTSTTTMEGTQNAGGMEMEMDMKGTHSGKGSLNMKTGLISTYYNSGKVEGTASIEANDQMPMDLIIPMTVETTVTTTLK